MNIEEIFINLVNEAKDNYIKFTDVYLEKYNLDYEVKYPIAFNTMIDGQTIIANDHLPLLIINNSKDFYSLLNKYILMVKEKNIKIPSYIKEVDKFIMAYLLVNATTEDFINPMAYIERRIAFLKDDKLAKYDNIIKLDFNNYFDNSLLEIKRDIQSIQMETPNKISFKLTKGEDYYNLADISYGIDNNTCYIYSIMNKQNKSNQSYYAKKMNRYLFKLNEGIEDKESLEYKKYKAGVNNYYPENISDVTPSFVLAICTFLKMLEKENINKIKIASYLPIRYNSRLIAAENSNDIINLKNRNDKIQENITNKFIRTFYRSSHHLKNLEINSLPYEIDEYLNIKLNKFKDINNSIIEETLNKIK